MPLLFVDESGTKEFVTPPRGMSQIFSPNNSVLVIGRVLAYIDNDVSTAYGVAHRIELTQPSQME